MEAKLSSGFLEVGMRLNHVALASLAPSLQVSVLLRLLQEQKGTTEDLKTNDKV